MILQFLQGKFDQKYYVEKEEVFDKYIYNHIVFYLQFLYSF